MTGPQQSTDLPTNLADLREKSLVAVALFSGAAGYGWFVWVVWARPAGAALSMAWLGIALLVAGAAGAVVARRRHPTLAAHLLVWAIVAAALCARLVFPAPDLAYLCLLPVILGSVLLGQAAHLLVAAVAGALILALGLAGAWPPWPAGSAFPLALGALMRSVVRAGVALPLAILALATAATWISARSLYTAVTWVFLGYEKARRNEEAARNQRGELRRVVKALDDATYRLERLNYMLTLTTAQAEEARRLKQQFAQTISHELRTPLNLILGFTELMTESPEYYGGQLPPAYLRDLGIVHRNAYHLQSLINDVLDLSRIEAAQLELTLEEVQPAEFIAEAVATARSLVEVRGLELRTDVAPDLPGVHVDATRIRQVLFNLLNNAARFTDEGSITVRAYQQDGELVVAVADTGVGIAPEDQAGIFEEFRQADGSTRRPHGGAGLGLAISKRFVTLHGGRIWVESVVGRGSTFYFALPAKARDAEVEGAPALRPGRPSASRSGIREEPVLLAVTRSPSAAALLMRYVRGFRVVVAADLEQAAQSCRQMVPQVVVVDSASHALEEEGSGSSPSSLAPGAGSPAYERLDELARSWGLGHVPIVACPLPGTELLRHLAVDGFLIKPVSHRSVRTALRQFGERIDKVLVIDDDQDFVLLMRRLVEDNPLRPCQAIGAFSGQEGLLMLRLHRPDLIFLDLGLPDLAGTEVVEAIRNEPEWRETPIVIVSGQDEMANQQTMRGAVVIEKVGGLTPSEAVRWIQEVADSTLTAPPATPERPATPPR